MNGPVARLISQPCGEHRTFGQGTLNIGVIQGGLAANVVAPSATASVMVRVVEEPAAVEARIRASLGPHVEFRADKTALVHVPVGKLSFAPEKLVENANTVLASVMRAKPSAAKGKYIKGITLSSTMGPGIPLDSSIADAAAKA